MSFFEKEIYLQEVDSTNTFLKTNSFKSPTIVYSFNQIKGRGRNERRWFDFKDKNLALSFSLPGKDIIIDPIWYTAIAALALIKLLKKIRVKDVWIKWPNDIYVKEKKISGILTETIWQENRIELLIVGIGININNSLDDLSLLENKATSLFIEKNKKFNLENFYKCYKKQVEKKLIELNKHKKIVKIKKEWFKHSKLKNKRVVFKENKKTIIGITDDIKIDGTLVIKSDNIKYEVKSGDVYLYDTH